MRNEKRTFSLTLLNNIQTFINCETGEKLQLTSNKINKIKIKQIIIFMSTPIFAE